MARESNRTGTDKFDDGARADLAFVEPEITFMPVPENISHGEAEDVPVWRVSLEITSSPRGRVGLDINGEVTLGRSKGKPDLVDLTPYQAAAQGVSRNHLMLRPTPSNLFAIDLGSTNGTLRNGRPIGQHVPSRLISGDTLTLGALQFVMRIVERPSFQTATLRRKSSLADAMAQIAKAVTSQLDVGEVLNQVAETAMVLTEAGETGIWLVDEKTGELFLEAERGIEDEKVRRMRLPIRDDTLIGQVIGTGKTLRTHRQLGHERIKVDTNYLVEALIYVPIALGGITLGVLAVVHRETGKKFKNRDEQILEAIADFAAIAVQNARLYQETDKALQHRVQELAAVNEVARAVSASLDLDQVYHVLVEQVNKHWPVEAVHLYLLDEERQTLQRHHLPKADAVKPHPVGEGIIGLVAQSAEVIVSNDVSAHPAFDQEIDSFDVEELGSIASVPLQVKNQVVGVLTLVNRVDGTFANEDVNRLKAFANPVATAIENARLFADSERQRAAILTTARTFSQPLLILDEQGDVLVANQAANQILETHMSQLFAGINISVGRTTEVHIGDRTYLATTDHLPEVGTIVIMQDITYVEQLEQARSELIHALSHDLKSPLTSILGWADLLRGDVDQEKRHEFLISLTSAAERMLSLINQMLTAVTEADAVQLVHESCDLEQIVSGVMEDVKGAALYKSITLTLETVGRAFSISADGTRLYHMVLNLVDNAIKYSFNDSKVHVQLEFDEHVVTIRVQDEGPGIPKEDMTHLFRKYYRGRQAKFHPGVGLGLSTVQAIADAHGGQVTAQNRPEGGAEFIVKLPGKLPQPAEG